MLARLLRPQQPLTSMSAVYDQPSMAVTAGAGESDDGLLVVLDGVAIAAVAALPELDRPTGAVCAAAAAAAGGGGAGCIPAAAARLAALVLGTAGSCESLILWALLTPQTRASAQGDKPGTQEQPQGGKPGT